MDQANTIRLIIAIVIGYGLLFLVLWIFSRKENKKKKFKYHETNKIKAKVKRLEKDLKITVAILSASIIGFI